MLNLNFILFIIQIILDSNLFRRTLSEVLNIYKPEVCVVQCGADSIVGDPLGGTNLLPEDLGICVERILSWDLPTLFLGGGMTIQLIKFDYYFFHSN